MSKPPRNSREIDPFAQVRGKREKKDKAPFDKVKGKSRLHSRNKHRDRYDLAALSVTSPELSAFVVKNIHGDDSVDFANPEAVKMLNKALLKHHYEIEGWEIPDGYLCPPIPGRADYIHHISDVLCASNYGVFPPAEKITCLDIGVGANCVYPLIGVKEYGWSFIGSDIDQVAIASAQKIIDQNASLSGKIELIHQENPKDLFYGVIRKEDRIDLSICNPPFHASAKAAEEVALKKLSNLNKKEVKEVTLNFGGQNSELWCDGGERKFTQDMIRESKKFGRSCFWFSTLVSKQSNLKGVYTSLQSASASEIKTLPMGQGNKSSRVVAWTFLTPEEQKDWKTERWSQ